jgi:hypothetical protein
VVEKRVEQRALAGERAAARWSGEGKRSSERKLFGVELVEDKG